MNILYLQSVQPSNEFQRVADPRTRKVLIGPYTTSWPAATLGSYPDEQNEEDRTGWARVKKSACVWNEGGQTNVGRRVVCLDERRVTSEHVDGIRSPGRL
jgi:hypothetical protein